MSSYNLKSIKQKFKDNGVFYTPPELALMIKSYITNDVKEVYDPTCGDGALLSVFDDNVKKYGQELDGNQLEVAKNRLINFNGVCGDTLKKPMFLDKKFDTIVANYPFSISWNPPTELECSIDERFNKSPTIPTKSKADYAFILHILHYLSDDGVAVVLNFPGILYRGGREGIIRRWIIEQNYIEQVVEIPPKTFVDTTIATALIIFKKNKTNTDIKFVNKELGIERFVSINEIKANDYSLSVNLYCQKEEKKEYVDPIKLEEKARKNFLNKLNNELVFSKKVSEMENIEFDSFLDNILDIVNKFKQAQEQPELF